jgi:hypothetical protein
VNIGQRRRTVVVDKRPGVVVVFAARLDERDADRLIAQLARLGLLARSVPALDFDMLGAQRHRQPTVKA